MQASDLGTPPLTSENSATVTVNVQRNNNCPRFESAEYTKTIDQTQGVNSQVLVVKAVDDDPQVGDRLTDRQLVKFLYSEIFLK